MTMRPKIKRTIKLLFVVLFVMSLVERIRTLAIYDVDEDGFVTFVDKSAGMSISIPADWRDLGRCRCGLAAYVVKLFSSERPSFLPTGRADYNLWVLYFSKNKQPPIGALSPPLTDPMAMVGFLVKLLSGESTSTTTEISVGVDNYQALYQEFAVADQRRSVHMVLIPKSVEEYLVVMLWGDNKLTPADRRKVFEQIVASIEIYGDE